MISELRLALATRSDAREISLLSKAAIEYGLAQTWTPRRVLHCIGDAGTNVAIAREASRLVGFGIMNYDDTWAHLALLAVREGSRRRGAGSALLEWLEKCASTAGIEVIRAEVRCKNRGARLFYAARGYSEGERLEGYYQGVEDAVRLEKRLWD